MGKFSFRAILDGLKPILTNLLKKNLVKAALKKLLGSATAGGVGGFLVKYVVENLFDEFAKPVIRLAFRKGYRVIDEADGKIVMEKVIKAKDEDDFDEYRTNIGNV